MSELAYVPLTKSTAEEHTDRLVELANLIPQVDYTRTNILAEKKGDRILHGKWDHSYAITENGRIIGFIMAYERAKEDNEQYPKNTLYISELAVAPEYQNRGIGRQLLDYFFIENNASGLLHLDGHLNYSLQTNSSDWNDKVLKLYESYGFRQRATKEYSNRVDVVMGYAPNHHVA